MGDPTLQRKEGLLRKFAIGRSIFGRRTWKERWFRIDGKCLTYAEGPMEPALNTIPLTFGAVSVIPDPDPAAYSGAKDPRCVFALAYEENQTTTRMLVMEACDTSTRGKWITCLQCCVSPESLTLSQQYRSRLVAIYTKYNPDKLSIVDQTLAKYAGKEEEMFRLLEAKYGSEGGGGAAENTGRGSRSMTVFAKTPAASPKNVSSPTPSSPTATPTATTVTRDRTATTIVPSTMAPVSTRDPTDADDDDRHLALYRDRLFNFYAEYRPEKIFEVDETLKKYKGKEEELFELLVEKYGPEP
eukprot:PhF_6_TR6180/c0_g1_i1/m.9267